MLRTLLPTLTAVAVLWLSACSDDGDNGGDAAEDPQAALETAAELLAETSSVRFTVEGEDLPDSGTVVVGAEGVAVPPSSFEGGVRVKAGALSSTVDVVSIDGEIWAQLPLTDGYEKMDATGLDFGDPGVLIDPEQGVGQLLRSGSDVAGADQVRVDGEVYDQVESVIPGELVDAILTLADPDADVQATWSLDPDTGRLRQATLTGPFYDGGEQTYVVSLDEYDEPAEISAPTG
ncbi:LppX_LprAFG lipoprotein [Phytoactinopolyspora halotolerans]|uniref:LppX_LprAFG lipoprotein n=1 Tax=Phytoactinopolyspora halotolerans TaxID=1981512 RepID=A0A6L9SHW7_9ACTN|nr:LppX_LprAFG lipoprotein [Phytoactinopolyspora halotolerans]NEE04258.1 LppX_LprAFG lipoprotein [Phytoactinopolyspora halotolerans]